MLTKLQTLSDAKNLENPVLDDTQNSELQLLLNLPFLSPTLLLGAWANFRMEACSEIEGGGPSFPPPPILSPPLRPESCCFNPTRS